MTHAPISRRGALGLIAVGTAGVAAGATGLVSGLGGGEGLSRAAVSGAPLAEPVMHASRDGVLDVELTAAAGVRLAGQDSAALGFNATSPGPTLRVQPGDLLRIRLTNHLNAPTNLHTHGLHVSPRDSGDNPFVSIEPGSAFDYSVRIPDDHPPGTHWYHPHRHGTVADQLFGGLAGGLLIGPHPDPDLPVTTERLLLITDITLDADGRVATVGPMQQMMGREGELVLVNGQHQPLIPAAPGTTQRWRIINGCTSRILSLRLTGHPLTQIAQDGAFLPAPDQRDRVVLAPGNRADVIVRPDRQGRYPLVIDPYDRGGHGMMGGRMGPSRTSEPITLATLAVDGPAGTSPPLPATLPAPTLPNGPVSRQRELTFAMDMGGMGMGGMSGMRATIDGRVFDPGRDDQTARLGSTEDWTITNTSPLDHPFHLHVWPFQVLDDSTGAPRGAPRQDVVLVPARGWVRLRIPFTDHPGRSVYHCHILDHEDAGMMGTITVTG